MKKTIKAFTLVEMLIVIVIIGILIASLMPRMQSAQGRARDVARKNDLAQIQTAIITSQQDRGRWPGMDSGAANGMILTGTILDQLKTAGMTQVPGDPNQSNEVWGLGLTNSAEGRYIYMVTTRNSVPEAGFALMAKTEVEGGSNWVVCGTTTSGASDKTLANGWIVPAQGTTPATDLKDVTTCTSFTKGTTCGINSGSCLYRDISELRYLLVY